MHAIPNKVKRTLYWKNHNPDNKNICRGIAPFCDNDASHKELFDMGLDYSKISAKLKKYPLYEETPFPTGTKKYDALKKYYTE